jgi:hypothetical protein
MTPPSHHVAIGTASGFAWQIGEFAAAGSARAMSANHIRG